MEENTTKPNGGSKEMKVINSDRVNEDIERFFSEGKSIEVRASMPKTHHSNDKKLLSGFDEQSKKITGNVENLKNGMIISLKGRNAKKEESKKEAKKVTKKVTKKATKKVEDKEIDSEDAKSEEK